MRFRRTLPPAAAPLCWTDLWQGIAGIVAPAPTLERFTEEIRRHFGVDHVFLVSSGTAALSLALSALRSLSSRTEVVIPAYTCFSVPAAVLRAGLRPRLCDVEPETFDFDRACLEQEVTASTLCVVTHHLFGIRSDVERTRQLCHALGALVVEDAAQAMGTEWQGHKLGTAGDVGIFSLGRGKTITCGSGGIIVTRSPEIAAAISEQYQRLPRSSMAESIKDVLQLVMLKVFIQPRLYWIPASLPWLRLGETIFPATVTLARLSGVKAGVLRNWRSRLADAARVRSDAAAYFGAHLRVSLPHGQSHPYLRLPIRVATRTDKERLCALSKQRGLGVSAGYPTPVNEIPEIRSAFDGERFPSARQVADTLVTVPTHQWLSQRDKRAIVDFLATAS
jgi:dTDP-4-amino-4,6-dideoxygalactose transaminase